MTPPRAVTFDYWQTLVSERRGDMRAMQIDRWVASLADAGQPRAEAELADAFAANWAIFEERWRANAGPWGAGEAVGFVSERLHVTLVDGLRERLIENFRVVGETAELHPAPGVHDCLRALKASGCALGIVCDVGLTGSPTLRARLQGFGLLDFFDAWAFSDETGWFKPAAEAFAPALDGLGVPPAEAAHVGDNERTDVTGAKGLGMVAVQYTGLASLAAWLPEQRPGTLADYVVEDLATLPAVLGFS
ncbi:MAG TPA: HAD family hydrolase [Actinomycetota bacterium]|nr:HAD family hydrolase [Actinomycetota bacterium]